MALSREASVVAQTVVCAIFQPPTFCWFASLFTNQWPITAQTQTLAWTIIFFVASAAASSAYLTVSEIFPLEIRGMAIAVFFAVGTLVGGVGAPLLFGWIIGTGSSTALFMGYLTAAALMILAAVMEAWIGVAAERRSLEHVAAPLSSKGL